MKNLEELIYKMSKLPGLGSRSARRLALHLLKQPEKLFDPLINSLHAVRNSICTCSICFNLSETSPCHICKDLSRIPGQLCVVADVADVWALERASAFKGKYHVLGGLLSAVDGVSPDKLTLPYLIDRIHKEDITEVVFALSATVDGQTTMHYILAQLKESQVRCSSLAYGIPVGGELDYLDDGTLNLALNARQDLPYAQSR